MEQSINDVVKEYRHLDGSIHLKPKIHYMLHLATQYETFSPVINHSTLRFEGKHAFVKNIINPSLSIDRKTNTYKFTITLRRSR